MWLYIKYRHFKIKKKNFFYQYILMNNQIKIIDLKKDKKSEQEKLYREMKKELLVLTNKEREKEG